MLTISNENEKKSETFRNLVYLSIIGTYLYLAYIYMAKKSKSVSILRLL